MKGWENIANLGNGERVAVDPTSRSAPWNVVHLSLLLLLAWGPFPTDGFAGAADPFFVGAVACCVTNAGNITVYVTVDPQSGAVPLTVHFDGVAVGGVAPYKFTWDFGDGSSWTGNGTANASHEYVSPGRFPSRLAVSDSLGSTGLSPIVSIEVRDERTLAVEIDAYPKWGNAPHAVYFSSTVRGGVPPYAFRWDLGDGAAVETPSPNHTYVDAGRYTVGLEVNDSNGSSANSTSIVIDVGERLPWLTAVGEGIPRMGEAPLVVQFHNWATGGVPPYYYSWDFGHGGPSVFVPNPVHVYTQPGYYNATPGVMDSASPPGAGVGAPLPLTVKTSKNSLPAAASASPLKGMTPLGVSFSGWASGGIPPYDFVWDFGNGHASRAANATYVYQAPGIFTAVFVAIDSTGARGNAPPITIEVEAGGGALAVTAIASPTSGPAPLAVNFTAVASGGDPVHWFHWDYGDGTNGSMPESRHVYATPGSYAAVVKVTDGQGATASSEPMVIAVGRPGNFTVRAHANPRSGAPPLDVGFRGEVTGALEPQWEWSFGDGSRTSEQSPNYTYRKAGSYDAMLTVIDRDGTMGAASVRVEVHAPAPLRLEVSPAEWSGNVGEGQLFEARVTSKEDGNVTDRAEYAWGSPRFGELNNSHQSSVRFTAHGSGVGVMSVRAYYQGNVASASVRIEIADPGPRPEIRILAPLNGSTVEGVVLVQGTARSATSLIAVEVKLDDSRWWNATPISPDWSSWEHQMDLAGLNGSHRIAARARTALTVSVETIVEVRISTTDDARDVPTGIRWAFVVLLVVGVIGSGGLLILLSRWRKKRRFRRIKDRAFGEERRPMTDAEMEAIRRAVEKVLKRRAAYAESGKREL